MSLSKNLRTIHDILTFLYGEEQGDRTFDRLQARMDQFQAESSRGFRRADELFSERDIVVITYGDLLQQQDEPPLATLRQFFLDYLDDVVNTIHILPFYPYSSDDGFSVIDYTKVNPALGSWDHIEQIKADDRRVMFDAVINHISARSDWFAAFKSGDAHYGDYFITVDPATDLSEVVRPRALPLLTGVETVHGTEHVWTTFSADQVDLNYQNPDTLLDVIDVLLTYIDHGADVIRLDAIAYLWKEIGTSCIHLPQTHAVIQLLRALVGEVAPGVLLITETNVPHDENISYFGDGEKEAHMVYNFSLPPLTAHALLTGSAQTLTGWASRLETPSRHTAFFNFTASHDGVGVRPAAGILDEKDMALLLQQTEANEGTVSSKTNADGSTSPYELNITYFDLLNGQEKSSQEIQVARFMASQAIMLALAGVPGIYLHSLLGSRNYTEGVEKTGHPRAINREKLSLEEVETELKAPRSLRHQVFEAYRHLLQQRITHSAFHPNGSQQILELHKAVFSVLRRSPDGNEIILALHNVSADPVSVQVDLKAIRVEAGRLLDCLSAQTMVVDNSGKIEVLLSAYQVRWLCHNVRNE